MKFVPKTKDTTHLPLSSSDYFTKYVTYLLDGRLVVCFLQMVPLAGLDLLLIVSVDPSEGSLAGPTVRLMVVAGSALET